MELLLSDCMCGSIGVCMKLNYAVKILALIGLISKVFAFVFAVTITQQCQAFTGLM